MGTITALLLGRAPGEDPELSRALSLVYDDLCRIARRCLWSERPTPTFDADCLVHEAYLRLVAHDRTQWRNRRHLFAVAVRIMRRILVDRARARQTVKRGPADRLTSLEGKEIGAGRGRVEILALEDALTDLQRYDEDLARLVELRFFGGLTNGEVADQFGVTKMTVIRRWRLARAWLERYLENRQS